MNYDTILKSASYFLALAEKENLETIFKNIENFETYSDRKKYAEKKLSHLSSGSSRMVYLTPAKTVLKLAKNDRGIAQNKVESNPKMKSKYLNKVLRKASNHAWIEVSFLKKITVKQFEKMTGLDFNEFGEAISYGLKTVSGSKDMKEPDNFDEVSKSHIYKDLVDVGRKFKLMPGDIARISSWGTKDGLPVLIDAGLTKNVFEEYYE